jgi:hypothetical protein
MADWVLFLAGIVMICLGMTHGLLMLMSPPRHRRFVFWLSTRFRRSELQSSDEDLRRGLELQYRLAGLGIVAGCGWLGSIFLRRLLDGHLKAVPTVPPPPDVGAMWFPFAAGLAAISGGLWFLRKPEAAFLWSIKELPVRQEIPDSKRGRIRRGFQVFGLSFVAFGLALLWVGIKCLAHACGR